MSRAAVKARQLQSKQEKRDDRKRADLVLQARAGMIWRMAADRVREIAKPGVTPVEMDKEIEALVRKEGGIPTNLGYDHGGQHRPYPAATCFMPNDMVTHGIPSTRPLRREDILTFDMGVTFQGMHADAAITFPVTPDPSEVPKEVANFLYSCNLALHAGIQECVPGKRVGDISRAIERVIVSDGYSIIRELCGHGINRVYHDSPQVPNFYPGHDGPKLREGQVLAIEPIIAMGSPEIRIADDGWSIFTVDGSLAAQFEHTVVCAQVPRILTETKFACK